MTQQIMEATIRVHGESDPLVAGTLDVLLANHALSRGYSARIFTYNVQMFDPTWFNGRRVDISERLRLQLEHKESGRLRVATEAYLRFLSASNRRGAITARVEIDVQEGAQVRRREKVVQDGDDLEDLTGRALYKDCRIGANVRILKR